MSSRFSVNSTQSAPASQPRTLASTGSYTFSPVGLLKILLLVLAILIGIDSAFARWTMLDTPASMAFYVCLYGILVISFIAAAYCRPFWVRMLFAVLFAASVQFYEGFRLTANVWPTYDTFVIMLESIGFAGSAWDHHRIPILRAIAHSLLVLVAVALKPPRFGRFAEYFALAPLAAIAMLSSLLFARGGDGANGLPPSFPGIGFTVIHTVNGVLSPTQPRQDVSLTPATQPHAHDLVYIIDESVLATYLDINHENGVYSGLDRVLPGSNIANFGIAASIALCSSSVNYTLRHGGTRADYARMNDTLPSIFAYARKAGMQTVYLDGQAINGQLSNLMYQRELDLIDHHVALHDVPVMIRDQRLANEISKLTNDDQSSFILVNKVGAHFPVQDKYPDSYIKYKPIGSRGNYVNISDTGSRVGFSGDVESWRLYRNAYRNTLLWNTGNFFDLIFEQADMQNTIILYTADHGQRLHEDGSPGQNTHCSPQPRPEEGAVPLVFIAPEDTPLDFAAAAATHHNNTSHYRLFPTMLKMMGYDSREVQAIYGEDITSATPDDYTYNAYFNARMGRKPVWLRIDPDDVATPLASDAEVRPLN